MKFMREKRAIYVADRRTSVSIEPEFWEGLLEAAKARGLFVWELVTSIDAERREPNLSSAIRVFVLDYYRDRVFSASTTNVERMIEKEEPRTSSSGAPRIARG